MHCLHSDEHQRRMIAFGRTLVAGVIALLLSVPAQPARAAAEDPIAQRVEKLASDAAVAYRGADYARTVELLEQAYKLRQMGVLLYNLAKAYDKLGDQEKAVELYRRYSASTDTDVSLRARADARIGAYEDTHRTHPRVVVDPLRVVIPPPVVPRVVKPEETPEARALRERNERRHRDRKLGIGLATTGGVIALVGAGLSSTAFVIHRDYENATGPEDARRAARDRGHALALSSDVLYGVAAVSAGVGAYFIWRGYHQERAPGARLTSVAPFAAPLAGGATTGFVLAGAF